MSYRSIMGKSLKEIRFVMCQQSAASVGARQFIYNNYSQIKQANPTLPFIVRECAGAQPTIMARYDFGVEKRVYVNDLSEKEVDAVVEELTTQAVKVNAAL